MAYQNPPYYISAYALACKQGFVGSLNDWLASLKGEKGDTGAGVQIKGKYNTLVALQAAHPTGEVGDYYTVGTTTDTQKVYYWEPLNGAWTEINIRGEKGDTGTTAYEYAVAGGYTGTEEDFEALLAGIQTYSNNAQTAAANAAASATAAAGSATDAASAKLAAETAEGNAQAYASTAASGASAASNSATLAETAKGAAAQSALNAASSASSAAGSAASASSSASSAESSASAANSSKTAAAGSATAAAGSASDAAQSATDAASAKTAAQTAESNAQGHAGTASAKATAAAGSASDAAQSAVSAAGSAEQAAASAAESNNRIFWVTRGTTTKAQIDAAITAGLWPVIKMGSNYLPLSKLETGTYGPGAGSYYDYWFVGGLYTGNVQYCDLYVYNGTETWRSLSNSHVATLQSAPGVKYVLGATNQTMYYILFGEEPEANSEKLLTSGVIYAALHQNKVLEDLRADEIPGTTQSYTFTDGAVSQVVHTDAEETAVRTDTFTYAANTITEVRTLNTGESLTIVTNLTTLETTVTYAAE